MEQLTCSLHCCHWEARNQWLVAWWCSHWCKVTCKVLWSMQLGAVIKCWAAYPKHSRGTFWQWRFIPKPQTPASHVLVEIRWLSYFHRWHWYETILKPCAPSSLKLLGSSDGWPITEIWKGTYELFNIYKWVGRASWARRCRSWPLASVFAKLPCSKVWITFQHSKEHEHETVRGIRCMRSKGEWVISSDLGFPWSYYSLVWPI